MLLSLELFDGVDEIFLSLSDPEGLKVCILILLNKEILESLSLALLG